MKVVGGSGYRSTESVVLRDLEVKHPDVSRMSLETLSPDTQTGVPSCKDVLSLPVREQKS